MSKSILKSEIIDHQMETVLSVRVVPRAGRSGPAGVRDNTFLIRLNAPPVEGAANAELIEVLADLFDIPKRNVTIVAGERSRSKRVRVIGISEEEARRRLIRSS